MHRNSPARVHTTLCFVVAAVVAVYCFFFACFFCFSGDVLSICGLQFSRRVRSRTFTRLLLRVVSILFLSCFQSSFVARIHRSQKTPFQICLRKSVPRYTVVLTFHFVIKILLLVHGITHQTEKLLRFFEKHCETERNVRTNFTAAIWTIQMQPDVLLTFLSYFITFSDQWTQDLKIIFVGPINNSFCEFLAF